MSKFPWLPVAVSATVSAAATYLLVSAFRSGSGSNRHRSGSTTASDQDVEKVRAKLSAMEKENTALQQENSELQATVEARNSKIVSLRSEIEMLGLLLAQSGPIDREVRAGMEDCWLFSAPPGSTNEDILGGLDLGVPKDHVVVKVGLPLPCAPSVFADDIVELYFFFRSCVGSSCSTSSNLLCGFFRRRW